MPPKPVQSKRKYYFWKYDLYPYLRCGPGFRLENGRVQTENFGKGFHFIPCHEFSIKEGKRFRGELARLEAERFKAMSDLHELYNARLASLLQEPWVVKAAVLR